MPIINKDHVDNFEWHFGVESILLDIKDDVLGILTALHKVNW